MRATEFVKEAKNITRALQFGAAGATVGGLSAYALARALDADSPWKYGLGGAAAGGLAGGLAGNMIAEKEQENSKLNGLSSWRLPYKTKDDTGYYTEEQIKDLQTLAKDYGLEGADDFARRDIGYLRKRLNGITDNSRPLVRYGLRKLNPEFQIAAAIHDLDFLEARGDDGKALEANARMARNLKRIAQQTGQDVFDSWFRSAITANVYKKVLDMFYKKNLEMARRKWMEDNGVTSV